MPAGEECQTIVDAFDALGSDAWRFIALFRFAESRPAEVTIEALRSAYALADTNNDIGLAYAWFLSRHGDTTGALEIVKRLPHIRFEAHRESHSWGFSDVTYTIRLRWLQEVLDIPEGPVPGATDEREEAYVRVEQTARTLGYLRAIAAHGQVPGDRHALFRSLLLFHNQPVHFSTLRPHQDFVLQTSRNEIYEHVAHLAKAIGPTGLTALRDVLQDLTTGPGAAQFTPHQRRQFAQLFYHQGVMPREDAVALGLSSTVDTGDDDPIQRQEACLEVAAFLHDIGDEAGSANWVTRASEVSAGAGSHKDYQMSHLSEWLVRSIPHVGSKQLEFSIVSSVASR